MFSILSYFITLDRLSFSFQFSLITDLSLILNNLLIKYLIHPLAVGRFYSFISNLKVHLQFIGWLTTHFFIFFIIPFLHHNLSSSFNIYIYVYLFHVTSPYYIFRFFCINFCKEYFMSLLSILLLVS
jgi:hypothetical protein